MTSRPRLLLKHALQTSFLTATLAASAAFGSSRPPQPPIAQQPFTMLPSRTSPQPTISHQARRAFEATAPITRTLTLGEKRVATQLLGGFLDTNAIRITFDTQGARVNTDSQTLTIVEPRFFSTDYSDENNAPVVFGHFVNQMTALAQRQAGATWIATGSGSGSLYPLDGRGFSAYSRAQQCAVMEDYALRFLHRSRQSYWLHKTYGGDKSITDPHLIAAVEGTFPAATQARKNFERMILRGLTDGEKALVQRIFGDQIDTGVVWMHLSPLAYSDVAGAVASATEVYFYGLNRSTDYSQEDPLKVGIFIHEMVHIWQFQTSRRYTVVENDIYKYTIRANARFENFNIEQQAAMLEDYVLYFTTPDKITRWLSQSYSPEETLQRMPYVIAAVEARFPGARNLRDINLRATPLVGAAPETVPITVVHEPQADTPEPTQLSVEPVLPVEPQPLPPVETKATEPQPLPPVETHTAEIVSLPTVELAPAEPQPLDRPKPETAEPTSTQDQTGNTPLPTGSTIAPVEPPVSLPKPPVRFDPPAL